MKAGDTILIPTPKTSYDSHLWMVISDPSIDGRCVIVNFTSWRIDKEQACVLDKGDHPYIKKKTCVNFKDAKNVREEDLDSLVAAHGLKHHDPLGPDLLERIRKAAAGSGMNWECVQVLTDHGLLTLD